MNLKCIIRTVLLLYCLVFTIKAQNTDWQDLVNRKQYATVIAHADSLTPSDSCDFKVMNAIGQAYEGMLRYRDAYNYYSHCHSMDTTNADMLNSLARMATNLGRAKDAESYYHKMLDGDSLNFYANYQLARLYYQLGNYKRAIEKYEKLQEQDEGNSSLWRNIGDCYSRMDLYPGAALAYFQAYSLNRENASLANTLVNTLYRLGGDYVMEGLAICDTALRYNPDNQQLLRCKGLGLYMTQDFTGADSIYSNLLAEGDSSHLTLKYGGASKYYAGQYLNSIALLEFAYEQDSTSVEVCLLLGSALGKTYDRQRAFALLDLAERGMQPSPLLKNQLLLFRGETHSKNGNRQEAARLYYEAWKNNPEKLGILASLSSLYGGIDVSEFSNEEERQRSLFIQQLYMNELLKKGLGMENAVYTRMFLQSYYEDMFFRNVTQETMIAPDGKRSKMYMIDLRGLINKIPEESDNVLAMRAAVAKANGKKDKAAQLYYQAWKVKATRVELAREICQLYNCLDISEFKTQEDLQRGVFAQVFYIKELIKNGLSLDNLDFTHASLQSLCDDMSRKGVTEQAMLAPDGQKDMLQMSELKSILGQLPEISASVKEMFDGMAKSKKMGEQDKK